MSEREAGRELDVLACDRCGALQLATPIRRYPICETVESLEDDSCGHYRITRCDGTMRPVGVLAAAHPEGGE